MTLTITHAIQAIGPEAGNGEIGLDEWNANHAVSMATNRLLGRATAGAGAIEELSLGAEFTLSGGTLALVTSYAPVNSPTLTGTPAAPSAAAWTETTQIATTDNVVKTVRLVPENAQTGTTYTLVLTDAGKLITLSNAASITLTIPTNTSVAFPVNTRIDLVQFGAGQVTIGGAGVTIRSSGSKLKLTGQYSGATLWKKGTDEWLLIGDIAA